MRWRLRYRSLLKTHPCCASLRFRQRRQQDKSTQFSAHGSIPRHFSAPGIRKKYPVELYAMHSSAVPHFPLEKIPRRIPVVRAEWKKALCARRRGVRDDRGLEAVSGGSELFEAPAYQPKLSMSRGRSISEWLTYRAHFLVQMNRLAYGTTQDGGSFPAPKITAAICNVLYSRCRKKYPQPFDHEIQSCPPTIDGHTAHEMRVGPMFDITRRTGV